MSFAESALATSRSDTDWTSRLPQTKHVQLFKSADWASTGLGPLGDWGPSLRFAASMVFADSRGGCVYWGQERTAFYNESFMPMAGSAHPLLMGKPFRVAFPELWDAIGPVFSQAESDGMTVDVENIPLFTERHGYLEETYFIGQFIPLRGDNGKVEGIYNTVYESTFRVLHDRRRAVLDLITALPSSSVSEVFQYIINALKTDGRDISMVLLYSAEEMTDSGTCQLTLRGSIGVPSGHRFAPAQGELHQSKDGLFALFRKARTVESPLMVLTGDESLQSSGTSLLDGISWAGFGERPNQVIIAPLANASRLFGFIVIGTNPRREYSASCQQFFGDLIQQLLVKMNSAVSTEEAIKREEVLLRDLADREKRIRYMAMYAPIGMAHVEVIGTVSWANDQFYDILGLSREAATSSMSFFDVLHDEGIAEAHKLWSRVVEGTPISCELRLKRLFTPPSGPPEPACVLAHCFPLKGDGAIRYIMSCVTDVSRLKWAESVQCLNAAAAQEAKRQQEAFVSIPIFYEDFL